MRNCLRSSQHTRHSRPVKPGKHARNDETRARNRLQTSLTPSWLRMAGTEEAASSHLAGDVLNRQGLRDLSGRTAATLAVMVSPRCAKSGVCAVPEAVDRTTAQRGISDAVSRRRMGNDDSEMGIGAITPAQNSRDHCGNSSMTSSWEISWTMVWSLISDQGRSHAVCDGLGGHWFTISYRHPPWLLEDVRPMRSAPSSFASSCVAGGVLAA
jgi:hypothetical protein